MAGGDMAMATSSISGKDESSPRRPEPFDVASANVVGGPVKRPWREGTLTRAAEIRSLRDWIVDGYRRSGQDGRADEVKELVTAIQAHLKAAKEAAERRSYLPRDGSRIERAMSNLDAAEADLLQLAPEEYLLGQMPALLHHVQRHLTPADPRRVGVERVAERIGMRDLTHPSASVDGTEPANRAEVIKRERATIVSAVRGASSSALREQTQVRSFRSVVVAMTLLMLATASLLGFMAWHNPAMIPLCFEPSTGDQITVVCPTGQSAPLPAQPDSEAPTRDVDNAIEETVSPSDMMLIEVIGAAAATVAAAAAIRRIRGSSEPYGVPVALALLKLPTGAMTAVLGLLLMRGEFVPGLSALDSSGQILSWAIVFGYAQQLFTRFVDRQGDTVLDRVRGGPSSPARLAPTAA
jgi:hypothetical protein